MTIKCIVVDTINDEMFALDFDGNRVTSKEVKSLLSEMKDWTDKGGDLLGMFAFSEPEDEE